MPNDHKNQNINQNDDPRENNQNSENRIGNNINVDVNVNVNTNIGESAYEEDGVTGYPPVNIVNSTPYDARGIVEYASFFCSDDRYNISGNGGIWNVPIEEFV
ncbi:hypothetical protein [Paucisalibacillus globulus]|uniref:hypothetical protein n=1 Tax=Paucisalibacillus globulus TaxID=351095 RepID=UPI0003F7357C|nr:hypothetical protein [Paucisalibacillus globulus]